MAERMKFSAIAALHPAVGDVRLLPDRAHGLVLGRPGRDGRRPPRRVAAAAGDAKAAAEAALAAVQANAGLAFQWGALDFAGGTVVHINSGIAGLIGALIVGKRVGFGNEAMPPHSLTMTLVGAALLWVGWFGFNAGSALEANGTAALAMINTFVATAAAALAWMLAEKIAKGKPSLLGARLRRGRRPRGRHAGRRASPDRWAPSCSASSPASCASSSARRIKNALGYDDALDVFGVHCIGGIIGAIGTGILAAPSLGGTGIFDYATGKVGRLRHGRAGDHAGQGGGLTLCGRASARCILHDREGHRRPAAWHDQEREGLDLVDHGERAYNY